MNAMIASLILQDVCFVFLVTPSGATGEIDSKGHLIRLKTKRCYYVPLSSESLAERKPIADSATSVTMPAGKELRVRLQFKSATDNALKRLAESERRDSIVSLDFAFSNATGSGFAHLKTLKNLREIRLFSCDKLKNECLSHVANVEKLERFSLSSESITDEGLSHLKGLKRLTQLDLSGCENITGKGLMHLADLPDLQTLTMAKCGVTDTGLTPLSRLKSLTYLNLERCHITGEGLVHVGKILQLERLSLEGCALIGSGLNHLRRLQSLEELDLSWCNTLTDDHLTGLENLTGLKKVSLYSCEGITHKGIAHLRPLENLEELNLSAESDAGPPAAQVDDKSLEHIGVLQNLRTLKIDLAGRVTEKGLAYLKGLTKLEVLELPWSTTNEGLAHLKNLTQLKDLQLCFSRVTDSGLAHLKLLKNLKSLNLFGCRNVNGTGVDHLRALPNLRLLAFGSEGSRVKLTADGLKAVGRLTQLRHLRLYGLNIKGEWLASLGGLSNLEILDLGECDNLTNRGLRNLKPLKRLKKLDVGFSEGITPSGVEDLKASLPNCAVDAIGIGD